MFHSGSMDAADWKAATVHMIDFEGSPGSGVVEFGVVSLREGRIASVLTELCQPVGTISGRDSSVHGIQDADASGRPPFSDYFPQFVEMRRSGVFAAHNRHAENTFIKNTWPLPPLVPNWRGQAGKVNEWGPWIDSLSVFKTVYPGLESYGLMELIERFGLSGRLAELAEDHCPASRSSPHCALYDALASSLLLLHMEEQDELTGRITVPWLLQLSRELNTQQELF